MINDFDYKYMFRGSDGVFYTVFISLWNTTIIAVSSARNRMLRAVVNVYSLRNQVNNHGIYFIWL